MATHVVYLKDENFGHENFSQNWEMGKNATKIFATNCKNGQNLPKINLFLRKYSQNSDFID